MTAQTTVDWPEVLGDLARCYGPLDPADPGQRKRLAIGTPTLAERLGVSRGTIRRWMDEGAEPRHSDGEMILARWVEATRRPRESAPTIRLQLSAAVLRAV